MQCKLQQRSSGNPMALAPVAFQVWTTAPALRSGCAVWANRDRFVLSCGHASMLLYSMIHLSGIKAIDHHGKVLPRPSISLDNIKNSAKLGSPCAGHPEFGEAAGIETTTGPLGQGCGNSVGMAIASKWLERPITDLASNSLTTTSHPVRRRRLDGRCSLRSRFDRGHLKLSNLCWMYDDNHITIEGETDLAFSEDVAKRFEGMGWNVVRVPMPMTCRRSRKP